MRRDADKDCGQVFNVTWSKCIWQPGDTRSQILSPSEKAESPRQPTAMQRNSDDVLEFSFKQNRSLVSSKNGGTSTVKPVAEAKLDDLQWKTPTRRFEEFSSAANRCTLDFSVREYL